MNMSTLNKDILLRIVTYLDRQDIKSLSEVCLHLCKIVQPVLFYKIHFSVNKPYSGFRKTIEYQQYRRFLEASLCFADYPQDVTLNVDGSDTQDMVVVLSALTWKNVRTVSIIGKNVPPPNLPEPLENALIAFFGSTAIPLIVSFVHVKGCFASSVQSVQHLALVETDLGDILKDCVVKTVRFVGPIWRSLEALGLMLCLMHFMIDWDLPYVEGTEWYKELRMSLTGMMKLQLLMVIFRGIIRDY